MEYCLGPGDGTASMWDAAVDTDLDGDGRLDSIGLDFDGDGRLDDVMADLDADGIADHAVLDLDNNDRAESYFTDDGSGTWTVSVDRAGQLKWFGLDGVEHVGGPLVDFDSDGQADDRLLDSDGDGRADRALCGDLAYVDTDADGRWDTQLIDSDGDGTADTVHEL
ncbi:MAG: pullulanase [Mycobacterium sp.]|jgi:hypothetical protein|nr:pullulanase [Mycobacterium sp.]